MKNLILPTENQVKNDIEKFIRLFGDIDINSLSKYLHFVNAVIDCEFELQRVDFNSYDFIRIYNLYTDSQIYYSFRNK